MVAIWYHICLLHTCKLLVLLSSSVLQLNGPPTVALHMFKDECICSYIVPKAFCFPLKAETMRSY